MLWKLGLFSVVCVDYFLSTLPNVNDYAFESSAAVEALLAPLKTCSSRSWNWSLCCNEFAFCSNLDGWHDESIADAQKARGVGERYRLKSKGYDSILILFFATELKRYQIHWAAIAMGLWLSGRKGWSQYRQLRWNQKDTLDSCDSGAQDVCTVKSWVDLSVDKKSQWLRSLDKKGNMNRLKNQISNVFYHSSGSSLY